MMRRRAWGALCAAVVTGAIAAAPASAAFPGRNGLLVVQPVKAGGLTIVNADGSGQRQICAGTACGKPSAPAWSADGLEIAYANGSDGNVGVVYADGTCLNCVGLDVTPFVVDPLPNAPTPRVASVGFTAAGDLGYADSAHQVVRAAIDNSNSHLVARRGRTPVWSASGRGAFVRRVKHRDEVLVSDKHGRHFRRLTSRSESSPSWAPDGRLLAVVHAGRIEIVDLRGHVRRELARGTSPVFSPDGKLIAFIGKGQRLLVSSSHGGRAHRVGSVTGLRLDWQPLPPKTPPPCTPLAGSKVVLSTPGATVTSRGSSGRTGFMACLETDGHERFLGSNGEVQYYKALSTYSVGSFALAGKYAAFASYTSYGNIDGASSSTANVIVMDLTTGRAAVTEGTDADPGTQSALPQPSVKTIAVTPTGSLAWETDIHSGPDRKQAIYAHDASGTRTLDTETIPNGAPGTVGLANLQITGTTVTWTHDGSPRSATLSS